MLSETLHYKILKAKERHEEITVLLGLPETLSQKNLFQQLSKEYAQLEDLASLMQEYESIQTQIQECLDLLQDHDMKEMAQIEERALQERLGTVIQSIKTALIPCDPLDAQSAYLEVRAGTGGQEACLFAADLLRMYLRYVDRQAGWTATILSAHESDLGGYKEVIVKIDGSFVYGKLKFESGGHRVQRIPQTETQGRIHTSACTVAILPEYNEISSVEILSTDLRIDTFRASGAGGQHVNKTDSAIRITHLPSGVVVECQEDRSQHKNRSKAMALLKTKLLSQQQERQRSERSSLRQSLVGSGDRSERIRTYNYPQGRLTDHRINLTLYQLDAILDGALEPIIEALSSEYHASLLTDLESSES
jgi:peptide chain release factor 1